MLARHYNCDVYPARCVRLPGNRFRLEIEDKLTLPRNESGSVDVPATTQLLADVVERWVREDPGQWMWFHKRWEISGRRRRRRGQSKDAAGQRQRQS
jgi:KDO2-lipid IV(A) lauroyltransferase